jgi:hypothetical protein
LNGESKATLVRRAAGLGIEGGATMTKDELVRAIRKAPARSGRS